jgi:hypothetical protein
MEPMYKRYSPTQLRAVITGPDTEPDRYVSHQALDSKEH